VGFALCIAFSGLFTFVVIARRTHFRLMLLLLLAEVLEADQEELLHV
jgi:hypothetical protein